MSINLFEGPDPISSQFPHVNSYNYAENSPVAFIDLWGLQRAKPPLLRGTISGSITQESSGFEVNAFGAKTGATFNIDANDLIGGSLSFDTNEGFTTDGSYFNSTESNFGVSAGDIFGVEVNLTVDTENDESTLSSSLSLGLFTLENVSTLDDNGQIVESDNFLNISFGIKTGFILGVDLSLSFSMHLSHDEAESKPIEPVVIRSND